ncbi:MAG: hypothetical protein EBR82_31455, partial [Caulobacteraceae bacterium]|nr:hypothetical protein [Caulobacteraceae bacterium]
MTSYTTIPDATFLASKPILGSTGIAMRDNPLAMFEGATGAPRLQPLALDLFLGDMAWSGTTG